jgi:protein-disulfide isomerase
MVQMKNIIYNKTHTHSMKEQKQNLGLPIAIVLAGVIIGGAVIYSNGQNPATDTADTNTTQTEEITYEDSVIAEKDQMLTFGHQVGDPDAPIVVVEFSDPQCPFCANFHLTMDKIMETYGANGSVAWRYIYLFPFDSRPDVHPNARPLAEAIECAAKVGGEDMYWAFTKAVFEGEKNGTTDVEKIGADLGLNVNALNACIENKETVDIVDKQHTFSESLGLRGTPHSVVILPDGTGYRINGAYPYDTVAITIEAALAGVPSGKIQYFLDLFQQQGITENDINAFVQKEFVPAITAAQGADDSMTE